ncbi:unnamed protein product, partial [Iphiclides podalirius]
MRCPTASPRGAHEPMQPPWHMDDERKLEKFVTVFTVESCRARRTFTACSPENSARLVRPLSANSENYSEECHRVGGVERESKSGQCAQKSMWQRRLELAIPWCAR